MNVDINKIFLILKDFNLEIESLKSRQSNLLNKIRKSIDIAKMDKINKNLGKK